MSASKKLRARLYPVLDIERLTVREAAAIIALVEAAEDAARRYPNDSDTRLNLGLAALRAEVEK